MTKSSSEVESGGVNEGVRFDGRDPYGAAVEKHSHKYTAHPQSC